MEVVDAGHVIRQRRQLVEVGGKHTEPTDLRRYVPGREEIVFYNKIRWQNILPFYHWKAYPQIRAIFWTQGYLVSTKHAV